MRKQMISIGAVAVTASLVAACGGSGNSAASTPAAPAQTATAAAQTSTAAAQTSTSQTTSAAAASTSTAANAAGSSGAATKLSISAPKSGMLMFSTDKLSAKAGTVEITFTNPAPEPHNFTIAKGTKVLAATPQFMGGSKTLTVKLAAGTYTYYCNVPGHRQAGMQGTLTVS